MDRGPWQDEAEGYGQSPAGKTCDARPRGLLVTWSVQEGSVRRQSQWEAQESNSLGGFPRRRKDLGHWDLVTGQAGTLRTLGRTQNQGQGQGSSGNDGKGWQVAFPPNEEASICGPHPKCLTPPSSCGLEAKACPKLEVSSTQDSTTSNRRRDVLIAL